jgi:hypothetical protein
LNLHPGDVKTARGNGGKSQHVGACDETAQPRTRTATRVENTNRAGAGSTQVGQFRLKESPDPTVGIRVQAVKGKQVRRIAIGVGDEIAETIQKRIDRDGFIRGRGQAILEGAPVSTGRDARVTEAGGYRFFAGWRSDPFFFDRRGALNSLQFTGDDYFADKDVCSIVVEVPNSALGSKKIGLWHRTLVPADAVCEHSTFARPGGLHALDAAKGRHRRQCRS